MAEKFENANGGAPSTEFDRSIARSAASDGSSSGTMTKTPPLVDGNGSALKRKDKCGGRPTESIES